MNLLVILSALVILGAIVIRLALPIEWIEDRILMHILARRNVALIDPVCGCKRSPDVALSEPCPDPEHRYSTERAFQALHREHNAFQS